MANEKKQNDNLVFYQPITPTWEWHNSNNNFNKIEIYLTNILALMIESYEIEYQFITYLDPEINMPPDLKGGMEFYKKKENRKKIGKLLISRIDPDHRKKWETLFEILNSNEFWDSLIKDRQSGDPTSHVLQGKIKIGESTQLIKTVIRDVLKANKNDDLKTLISDYFNDDEITFFYKAKEGVVSNKTFKEWLKEKGNDIKINDTILEKIQALIDKAVDDFTWKERQIYNKKEQVIERRMSRANINLPKGKKFTTEIDFKLNDFLSDYLNAALNTDFLDNKNNIDNIRKAIVEQLYDTLNKQKGKNKDLIDVRLSILTSEGKSLTITSPKIDNKSYNYFSPHLKKLEPGITQEAIDLAVKEQSGKEDAKQRYTKYIGDEHIENFTTRFLILLNYFYNKKIKELKEENIKVGEENMDDFLLSIKEDLKKVFKENVKNFFFNKKGEPNFKKEKDKFKSYYFWEDYINANYSNQFKTKGEIQENILTALLKSKGMPAYQAGSIRYADNISKSEIFSDVFIPFGKTRVIGIQAKAYPSAEFDLTPSFYDQEINIFNNTLYQHITGNDSNQFINDLRRYSLCSNQDGKYENYASSFLASYFSNFSRLTAFGRVIDEIQGQLAMINFYFFNYQLYPVSFILYKLGDEIAQGVYNEYFILPKVPIKKEQSFCVNYSSMPPGPYSDPTEAFQAYYNKFINGDAKVMNIYLAESKEDHVFSIKKENKLSPIQANIKTIPVKLNNNNLVDLTERKVRFFLG